jgi:branched-chain amino acid transport system permease protein
MFLKKIFRPKYYVPFIALILLIISPTFLDPFLLHIFILTMLYAVLGSAWNFVGGYAGQISLGHTAFFGIGAYTSTLLYFNFGISPWWGMFMGAFLSVIVSALVGYPSFRLRGPFFALSTIAFAEVMHIVAIHWRQVTEGSVGVGIPFNPALKNFVFTSKMTYAYLAIILLFVVSVVSFLVRKSKCGFYLSALREDEDGARALGINTPKYKLIAMMISAFFCSIAGTFYSQYILFIDPYTVFTLALSINMALVTIIGGIGTVLGPIIGSFLMVPLGEFLRAEMGGIFGGGANLIIYGVILILVVHYMPYGIMAGVRKKYHKLLTVLPNSGEKEDFPKNPPAQSSHPYVPSPLIKNYESPFLLEVQDLSKRFGGLKAVSKVNLKIRPGEIVGLIGPNGAGKTTLFNVISGVYAPDNGRVIFKGLEVNGFKPYNLCQQGMGRTFQIVKPFGNMSVLDNVTTGGFCHLSNVALATDLAKEILGYVGLGEKQDMLAHSLTLPDKKRLELAKALATQPDLILLDEVMAGLNQREVSETVGLIRKISERGITIMIIEHVMPVIMSLCQRIIVLNHGEKISEGVPEELAKDRKVIEAYLGEEYFIAGSKKG